MKAEEVVREIGRAMHEAYKIHPTFMDENKEEISFLMGNLIERIIENESKTD